jgi:hypothetical protein
MAPNAHVSRRAVFAAAAAALAGTAGLAAPLRFDTVGEPDPIFALIEKHRAAVAAMDAAGEARDALEEKLFPNGREAEDESSWQRQLDEHPDLAAAVDASAAWIEAEKAAFADILRAVPSATQAGFFALACYACDITCEEEGAAVEGASYAYRVLAALAGRPVFGGVNDAEGERA